MKRCGFQDKKCDANCSMYCQGLNACVLHGINKNLSEMLLQLRSMNMQVVEMNRQNEKDNS